MKSQNPHINALLHDWAERHSLPAIQSETIRNAVLFSAEPLSVHTTETTTPELTVAWWHQLFASLALTLPQSTNINRYLLPTTLP